MILGLVQIWSLTLVLAVLFVAGGRSLRRALDPLDQDRDPSFEHGASFFLGLMAFLVSWRLLAVVIGSARLSCYLALLTLMALAVLGRRPRGLPRVTASGLKRWGAVCLLTGVFTFTTLLFWFHPTLTPETLAHFGSIHSGRYANPAIFIATHDWIPRLAQNYGQSLLAASHMFLGTRSPLASLTAWLGACHAFLALCLFGFLRERLGSDPKAAVGAFAVLCCNVSLSLTHVLVFDNGSPIFTMGYSDVVVSVGTWILFVDWFWRWHARGLPRVPRMLVFAILASLGWAMIAPQDTAFALLLCAASGLYLAWRRQSGGAMRLATVLSLFLLATGVGAGLGGLFMPERWADRVFIPGTQVVKAGAPQVLYPRLQFVVSHNGWIRFGSSLDAPEDSELVARARPWGWGELFRTVAFRIESSLWTAVRMLFFPLLGIVGLGCLLALQRGRFDEARASFFRFWNACAAVCLAAGFVIAFFVRISGFKWPLTRFLIPGVVLALVSLVFALEHAGRRAGPRFQSALWAAVVILSTFGPLVETGLRIHAQLGPDSAPAPFAARVHVLLETQEIVPEVAAFTAW